MQCYYHSDSEALHTCSVCNKPICQSCFYNNFPVWCTTCANVYYIAERKSQSKIAKKDLLVIGIAFIMGFLLDPYIGGRGNFASSLLSGYIVSGIYPAWTLLPKIPKINIVIALLGLGLKLAISVCLGVFIMPIKVYQAVRALF